jgi:Core-2/I-Branching enzyme
VTELAAIVLAHADPVHLRRLVAALEDVPIVLHCDAKTPRPLFDQMVRGLPRRVTLSQRLPASLASWSLVQAELNALREILARTRADHIAVLSGSDYPLTSVDVLLQDLRGWKDRSYFRSVPLPFAQWDHHKHPDGGLWRLQSRFLTRGDQLVRFREMPLRWPIKRRLPPEVRLRASTQWKIYARAHAQLLLTVVDARPDLVRFWRTTFIPDETFAGSMLASPALVGYEAALPPCFAQPWYQEWGRPAEHPKWLECSDFDALRAARWNPPADPAEVTDDQYVTTTPHRKLFARKFSTRVDTRVLDCIDKDLRR